MSSELSRREYKLIRRAAEGMTRPMVRYSQAVQRGQVLEDAAREHIAEAARRQIGKVGIRRAIQALYSVRGLLQRNLNENNKWRGIRILFEPVEETFMKWTGEPDAEAFRRQREQRTVELDLPSEG